MQPVTSLQGAAAVFTFTQQRVYIDLQHIDVSRGSSAERRRLCSIPGQVRDPPTPTTPPFTPFLSFLKSIFVFLDTIRGGGVGVGGPSASRCFSSAASFHTKIQFMEHFCGYPGRWGSPSSVDGRWMLVRSRSAADAAARTRRPAGVNATSTAAISSPPACGVNLQLLNLAPNLHMPLIVSLIRL